MYLRSSVRGVTRSPRPPWVFRHARHAWTDVRKATAIGNPACARRAACRDRVEVWLAVYADLTAPRAWTLLEDACRLLGHLFRDANILAQAQAQVPAHEHAFHHACWIARGLLGCAPAEWELAGAESAADARALLFATMLAEPAALRVTVADLRRRWGPAREMTAVVDAALIHVRCDEPLLLLE